MWATHPQTPVFGYPVEPYKLESSDGGATWTQPDTSAQLTVGASGTYDDYAIETPSVVKFSVDGKYHMYYTAEPSATPTEWAIGHATASSPSGPWTKDTNNPILSLTDLTSLGTLIVAEPGAVEWNSKIYLFFTTIKASGASSPMNLLYQIGVAESTDGSTFTNKRIAFDQLQSDSIWPRSQNYTGFSTPAPAVLDSKLYVFHGVYQAGYNSACVAQDGTQVAVSYAYASSPDGTFSLASSAIFVRSNFTWTACEIRGANAVLDPNAASDAPAALVYFAGQYVASDYSTITYGIAHTRTVLPYTASASLGSIVTPSVASTVAALFVVGLSMSFFF